MKSRRPKPSVALKVTLVAACVLLIGFAAAAQVQHAVPVAPPAQAPIAAPEPAARNSAEPTAPVRIASRIQPVAGNQRVTNFRAAKLYLSVLYAEHPYTLYSDCRFADAQIDYGHCAWRPRKANARAMRVEWEHIVPAEAFGQGLPAWHTGDPSCVDSHGRAFHGRRCAARASADFRRMEADLYNLVPEIGELNQLRSNKPMAELGDADGEPLASIGGLVAKRGFMPRDAAKGDVARAYLYMQANYPQVNMLSRKQAQLFSVWAAADPVDAWECRRAFRIEGIQGNENAYVKGPCQALGLWPVPVTP